MYRLIIALFLVGHFSSFAHSPPGESDSNRPEESVDSLALVCKAKESESVVLVRVEDSNGQSTEAELRSMNAAGVGLMGGHSFKTDDIFQIQFLNETPVAEPAAGFYVVTLRDGSSFNANKVSMDKDGMYSFILNDGRAINLKYSNIASYHRVFSGDQQEENRKYWDTMISEANSKETTGDLLAIQKKSGEIKFAEVGIDKIDDEHVHVDLDGDKIPVSKSKVQGFIAFPAGPEVAPSKKWLHLKDGSKIGVSQAEFVNGNVVATGGTGLKMCFPVEVIKSVDLGSGNLVSIEKMELTKAEVTPFLDVAEIPFLKDFNKPRPVIETVRGKKIAGLLVRSKTEVEIPLHKDYRTFKGDMAIIDSSLEDAHVIVSVFDSSDSANPKQLWPAKDHGGISRKSDPEAFSIDVSQVRKLRIVVDYGEHEDLGDQLLIRAKFLKN